MRYRYERMETFTKNRMRVAWLTTFLILFGSVAQAYPCEKFLTRVRDSWVPPRVFVPAQNGEKRKLSKWVKTPPKVLAGMIVTAIPFVAADMYAQYKNIEGFQKQVQDHVYGADTIAEWVATDGLTADAGREIFWHQLAQFKNHLAPLEQRRRDFVRLGWWTPKAGDVAEKIISDLSAKPDAWIVREDLLRAITRHPDFQSLFNEMKPGYEFSMNFWLTPKVVYLGKPDVEWLALLMGENEPNWTDQQKAGVESIRQFYAAHPEATFVTLVELTARTLKQSSAIEKKLTRAKELGLPTYRISFSRADFPDFEDELAIWQKMLLNFHFKAVADAWKSGQLDDYKALKLTESLDKSHHP